MDRKAYLKAYRAEYKKRMKVVKITLPIPAFVKLQKLAANEGKKPATLARDLMLAQMNDETFMPSQIEAELRALRFLMRNIANNVNQMAHHSNTIGKVVEEFKVFEELKNLEGQINRYTQGRLAEIQS